VPVGDRLHLVVGVEGLGDRGDLTWVGDRGLVSRAVVAVGHGHPGPGGLGGAVGLGDLHRLVGGVVAGRDRVVAGVGGGCLVAVGVVAGLGGMAERVGGRGEVAVGVVAVGGAPGGGG